MKARLRRSAPAHASRPWPENAEPAPKPKVFWFFSSEKNILLSLALCLTFLKSHATADPSNAMQIGASVLTQDGDEMLVSATLRWRAQDGVGAQSEAVLRAAFEAAAVAVAARHRAADLNGAFGEIVSFTRQTLAALARDADGFGVELTAAAGGASLPAAVRAPADAAEAEALRAEAALAAVRDAAALQLQTTDHDRDRMFAEARKAAAARVAAAREHAAAVTGLEARMSAPSRPALLAEFYRERIAAILRQAGSVSTVDPKSVSKVVIPDSGP